MDYSFTEEEKKYIINKKALLLTLNKDSTKCYKNFMKNLQIIFVILLKNGKKCDVRIRKHIFIQSVTK